MNRVLKSVLKTAACIMDQYAEQVNRASDRVVEVVGEGKKMIYRREDQGLRNVLSFAAALGVGVGAAILFAPASGKGLRNSIKEKVQDVRGLAG